LSISSQKYEFGIRDPRSGIRKKPIPDPGSRGQKGTGSRIRNTEYNPRKFNLIIKIYDFMIFAVARYTKMNTMRRIHLPMVGVAPLHNVVTPSSLNTFF
jgi:hypothetical protein